MTALYRHFAVRRRGELLAYVLKRIGRLEWKRSLNLLPADRPGD